MTTRLIALLGTILLIVLVWKGSFFVAFHVGYGGWIFAMIILCTIAVIELIEMLLHADKAAHHPVEETDRRDIDNPAPPPL